MKIKTMKNKNIYSKFCKVIWLLMLVVIVMSVIHGAMLYKYCQMYPQKEYTTDKSNPELPEEALTKIRLMNILRFDLGIGLFLLVLYFFCQYKEEPKDHWLTRVIKSIKKTNLEDN